MTDITERLRGMAARDDISALTSWTIEEAADEIERLRAALRFYSEEWRYEEFKEDSIAAASDRSVGSELGHDRGDRARAALRGQG
ncbi:MAG: hypothetical protein ACOY7L_16995 [Pseudomonadota bacterium]